MVGPLLWCCLWMPLLIMCVEGKASESACLLQRARGPSASSVELATPQTLNDTVQLLGSEAVSLGRVGKIVAALTKVQAHAAFDGVQVMEMMAVPVGTIAFGLLMTLSGMRSAGLLMAFFGAQTAMNLYMKAVLSVVQINDELSGVQAPFAITALQQLVAFLLLATALPCLKCLGVDVQCRFAQGTQLKFVMCLAVAFACNIGLNNLSLSLLDASVHLMIRTAGPIAGILLEMSFAGLLNRLAGANEEGPKINAQEVAFTVAATLCGLMVVLAKVEDIPDQQASSQFIVGAVACLLSLLASSLEVMLARRIGTTLKFNCIEVLLNMALPACVLLLVPAAFFRHAVVWGGSMTDLEVMREVWNSSRSAVGLGALSGVFAVSFNALLYTLSQTCDAHVISLQANVNKLVLLCMSVAFGLEVVPGAPWDRVMWLGVAGQAAILLIMLGQRGQNHRQGKDEA
eukprot:gb/GFBE01070272.1/.p1 GENE.gb/GFBE01070272.1/~~gb/GFBE01070272.1/.p1  ORF type:complete len:458 (+),score=96.03 gb/GFBE01070272.1/:1-1374(+)